MNTDPNQTLDALVAHFPAAIGVLDRFGIDYCCDRHQSLEEASRAAGISFDEITRCLAQAEHIDYSPVTKWMDPPLSDLMKHIVDTHHVYCRQALERIGSLLNEVAQKHGKLHPELQHILSSFSTLSSGMTMHLLKEEQTLFPMIARIEEARARQQPLPRLPFGTIRNPITMMGYEHDEAALPLRQIRQASHGYQAPADADSAYREAFEALKAFEQDMHQHVYLEDYILFPRVIALEKAAA
jgi:regulator of cell morphogenesis and NO signaling